MDKLLNTSSSDAPSGCPTAHRCCSLPAQEQATYHSTWRKGQIQTAGHQIWVQFEQRHGYKTASGRISEKQATSQPWYRRHKHSTNDINPVVLTKQVSLQDPEHLEKCLQIDLLLTTYVYFRDVACNIDVDFHLYGLKGDHAGA
jgi:hypothetical protein